MPHLILLGDSILDNAAYTEGGPDVVTQLRAARRLGRLAAGHRRLYHRRHRRPGRLPSF
jgi:hypothetical protein